jgi:hypothetical protein
MREVVDRFESFGATKMELFDRLELFYNQQRRHFTLGQIRAAAVDRKALRREKGQDGTI